MRLTFAEIPLIGPNRNIIALSLREKKWILKEIVEYCPFLWGDMDWMIESLNVGTGNKFSVALSFSK